MSNVQEYIDSGVLHDYCMNVLSDYERAVVQMMCKKHPEVKEELELLQQSLTRFAEQRATQPATQVKEAIWGTLENINKEKAGDLNDLPILNKYSNHINWLRMVQPIMPETMNEAVVMIPLRNHGGITQTLAISTLGVPDETHEDERESLLVLDGECECCIGDDVFRLGPGGFIEIPLHVHHNVRLLTPKVTAVVQHVAV